ncbi:MAG: XRE family transcriptional regulator [Acidobacteria bacterium]|nr:XRE family transcriptional regulator [Acidobacteriota bacterium]
MIKARLKRLKTLDKDQLTVRAAHDRTGIVAADFSRSRNADLGRCTVDRLMSVLNRLGSRVEVKIRVRRVRRRYINHMGVRT